jgi:hypothetical protein
MFSGTPAATPIDYQMPKALGSSSALTSSPRGSTKRSADSDSDEEFTFLGENVTVSRNPTYDSVKQRQAVVVKGSMPTDFTKGQEASSPASSAPAAAAASSGPMLVKVTPYIPQRNPQKIRERSLRVLEKLRLEEERLTGQPQRLVYDEETGFLLPRDQIVQYDSPQPGAALGSPDHSHYPRSLEVMRELREERMMRHFEGL